MERFDPPDLTGLRFLVVEDEFLIGRALCDELLAMGADIVGFHGNVASAAARVTEGPPIDCAIVDFNLAGTPSTPVIDLLVAKGVMPILCTGYDIASIDERLRHLPRCLKPLTRASLHRVLGSMSFAGGRPGGAPKADAV